MDREKWEELVSKAPFVQKLVNENMVFKTKEIQLVAVKQNGNNIQYIQNPDKDVQLAAVKQDSYSIQFIHNTPFTVFFNISLFFNP